MDAKTALRGDLEMGLFVLQQYVGDLGDADLLQRPGPGCNHLAWQLGHLISSESVLVNMILPGRGGELPAGFAERHSKETVGVDDPTKFDAKQAYLDLYAQVRTATLAALESLTDDDLAQPAPERLRGRFPRVADVVRLIGLHPLMHAGQFVPVRRRLGKPVLI